MLKYTYLLLTLNLLCSCGKTNISGLSTSATTSPTFCELNPGGTLHNEFGSGTSTDPYIICTAIQWQAIGANSADWDKVYELGASISLIDYAGTTYNIIGNLTTPFSGSLDGKNYSISDLTYNDNSSDYIGLFGYIKTTYNKIQRLKLLDFNITGRTAVGSLAGRVDYTKINSIFTTGSVTGNQSVGGVTGYVEFSLFDSIESQVGVQSNMDRVGGVSGYTNNSRLENIIWNGTKVQSIGNSYAGGIVGVSNASFLKNCFVKGDIQSIDVAGGIMGRLWSNTRVHNCFVDVNVSGGNTSADVGIVSGQLNGSTTNIYYESNSTCTNSDASGCNNDFLTNPIDTSVDTNYFFNKINEPLASWSFTKSWRVNSNSYPSLNPKFLSSNWGDCSTHQSNSSFAGGSGTLSSPYIVCNANQFNLIGADNNLWDSHFEVRADIDFNDLGATTYNMIGAAGDPFNGTLGAIGYKLENLNINLPAVDNVGLISTVQKSFLYGVSLRNATVIGNDNTGGIVGTEETFNITNIVFSSVTGTITGDDFVGGLAGKLPTHGQIHHSYNTANILGAGNEHGGIAGRYGYIYYSYNTGDVNGNGRVGGLGGNHNGQQQIGNSFSNADVIGGTTNIGSLAGSTIAPSTVNSYYNSTNLCTFCDVTYGTDNTIMIDFYDPTSPVLQNWDFNIFWEDNFGVNTYPTHKFLP